MVAIMGMMFQNGWTGTTGPAMWIPGAAFENELGVQPPVGFWDPMGFTKDGDVEDFRRRRETEIKHGRVAMYATMGYITPEYYKFPGYLAPSSNLKFADVPNGLKAISVVPAQGWVQWVALCGLYEFVINEPVKAEEPGNYGKGWLGITGKSVEDPAKRTRGLNSEIANGRLAMMAIIGMFFQDGLTGQAWGDWSLFTASPLRAFESELGVQAPVGFWDPLGFTADGDVNNFKRRRSVEIKHGRICMLATMGYITPEITGKLPGYLSPSAGLKFADIPNGLAAVSKVPGLGWLQIVIYGGLCEASGKNARGEAPGDFQWKPPLLATEDPELNTKRLNAELANGRLAMMAILGMFFSRMALQELLRVIGRITQTHHC